MGRFATRSLLALPLAALVAVALPAGASATHKPGHGQSPGATDVTIAAQPTSIVYGSGSVFSGRLRAADNAGKTLELWADGYPFGGGEARVATALTTSSGSYSVTRRPGRNTNYHVRYGAFRSASVLVNVRFRMSVSVSDATPRAGSLVRFSGRACPASDGAVVSIQRRTSTGSYRTVARTALRAATRCSVYRRSIRVRSDGTYRVTTDDAARARGYSRARFLDAH
ncbi:MAG TPA: hypothetical protein VEQ61_02780 [Thermoleophilaceae bacterium]|nr:hypothetical protein [Thermoleophilaceae bacterium]